MHVESLETSRFFVYSPIRAAMISAPDSRERDRRPMIPSLARGRQSWRRTSIRLSLERKGMIWFRRLASIGVHLIGSAATCAVAAYWVLQIATPPPGSAPPPLLAPLPREPDQTLAARMFGQVLMAPTAVASNIQVAGVFAAGRDSSAVLVVDNKPGRAVLLGQEIVPGVRLAEVRADGVTIDSGGSSSRLTVPPLAVASASSAAPGFTRSGNTLTAPSVEPSAASRPLPVRPGPLPPRAGLEEPGGPRARGEEPPAAPRFNVGAGTPPAQ
jgi:general secretion pathway protein C